MQARSETLEKAFNKLMSCGNSRCCVCSVLESPNPFSKFQRKRLDALVYQLERENSRASGSNPQSPLTVIVKRSMVKLPTSLLLSNSQPTHTDSDLITCSECNICVHKCEYYFSSSCQNTTILEKVFNLSFWISCPKMIAALLLADDWHSVFALYSLLWSW